MIRRVHTAYLRAGADVIATASYQATLEGFRARGLSFEAAADLLRLSVRLAIEARDDFWACSGTSQREDATASCRFDRPLWSLSRQRVRVHRRLCARARTSWLNSIGPRMQVLAGAEADLFAFETVPSLMEARAIVRSAAGVSRVRLPGSRSVVGTDAV